MLYKGRNERKSPVICNKTLMHCAGYSKSLNTHVGHDEVSLKGKRDINPNLW